MRRSYEADAGTKKRLKQLGLKVSYLRRCRGMSQEDLAELTGFSLSHLAKIEANTGVKPCKPSIDFIFKVADVLDVPVSVLFEEGIPPKTEEKKRR